MPPETPHTTPAIPVTVLVSLGLHPRSGRPRRASQDARALELTLREATCEPTVVHAGRLDEETEPALRKYLGMGVPGLTLLQQTDDADAVPALLEHLRARPPCMVVTGMHAERGEGSGLLPYLLAECMGWPLVTGVAVLESVTAESLTVLQALPRGQRRRLRVRLPCVVTVDEAAPSPRQSAFGPARRGTFDVIEVTSKPDTMHASIETTPARKRPKRLKMIRAASARDRFKAAAAKAEGTGGRILTDVSPAQGADAILELLRDEGVLR
ncbi:electron transfer flavoprotein beta subunit [Natronocella acetinitrilica]|uniref:Electron transfer flavoprotein beta subunit n=1 Tax=Natronocella acetinitrilica TaxID=414046 RepID=A0AAE3KEL3_9GAMM|nr:hypothetical protein [Natronocella acetinitrilica]MCP1673207.1 electron transfer flavoprotein beta subunit [Natronocella acetinitrilica]